MSQIPTRIVSMAGRMAESLKVDPEALLEVLHATVLPKGSPADVQAFLLVATQYGLNPITKEIYAFPAKGGGIQPMVGVDGWIKLANKQDSFDGVDFEHSDDENGKPISVSCTVWRSDRSRGHTATEFYSECKRNTDPWRDMPHRMLRHRALVQALRMAFGFSGIMERDEAEAWQEREAAPAREPRPGGPKSAADVREEGRRLREARETEVEVRDPGTSSARVVPAEDEAPSDDEPVSDDLADTFAGNADPETGELYEGDETSDPEASR